jgi:hypothetical protein
VNILIDSNILIPLEDTGKELPPQLAEMRRLAQKINFRLFIHPAQQNDIKRDKNETRRGIVLSRIAQYEKIPNAPIASAEVAKERKWSHSTPNDTIDNSLLLSVVQNACHLLVTNDRGIHRKANISGISERVHYLDQFSVFLKNQVGEDHPPPLGLRETFLHELNLASPFFDSLRANYGGFNNWFTQKAREQRKSWAVLDGDQLLAVCIFNIEDNPQITDTGLHLPGKALKLCTFKVSEQWRGRKMGERFLYSAFQYAKRNACKWVYLHTFGKEQETLVELCIDFGFSFFGKYNLRDDVYAKPMDAPEGATVDTPLDFAKKYYPAYLDNTDITKYLIPIQPAYHDELFPDRAEPTLFNSLPENIPPQSNTIKKAYLCHASISPPCAGDLVYFYRTHDRKATECIGIIEHAFRSAIPEQVLPEVSKRTVYNISQLHQILQKETLVILFRLIRYFKPIEKNHLESIGIKMPLQTIRKLSAEAGVLLKQNIDA